jgi:hypothetical protein
VRKPCKLQHQRQEIDARPMLVPSVPSPVGLPLPEVFDLSPYISGSYAPRSHNGPLIGFGLFVRDQVLVPLGSWIFGTWGSCLASPRQAPGVNDGVMMMTPPLDTVMYRTLTGERTPASTGGDVAGKAEGLRLGGQDARRDKAGDVRLREEGTTSCGGRTYERPADGFGVGRLAMGRKGYIPANPRTCTFEGVGGGGTPLGSRPRSLVRTHPAIFRSSPVPPPWSSTPLGFAFRHHVRHGGVPAVLPIGNNIRSHRSYSRVGQVGPLHSRRLPCVGFPFSV